MGSCQLVTGRAGGALAGGAPNGGALDGGALDGGALAGGALDIGAPNGGALDGGALASGALDGGAPNGGALAGVAGGGQPIAPDGAGGALVGSCQPDPSRGSYHRSRLPRDSNSNTGSTRCLSCSN